jgi:hypothetical protein
MVHLTPPLERADPQAFRFYRAVLATLARSEVPVLVGGAYALDSYTGIVRHTKDFDLFTCPAQAPRLLDVLARSGYRIEMTFPHWLGKAFSGEAAIRGEHPPDSPQDFVDVIFSSGNGLCAVDDDWFAHARPAVVLGAEVRLIPAEEMIWQKAFIMERERFDGADINHIIRAQGPSLDWSRLVARFGSHWRVLLSHLILFGYVYPDERDKVPPTILNELIRRLTIHATNESGEARVCYGPNLSREQYLIDTEIWSYGDCRLPPSGQMTPEQITHWTAGIEREPGLCIPSARRSPRRDIT